eukprot:8233414-Heterocapsa_arctica.AAC.1
MTEDHDQVRKYLAESTLQLGLMNERARLDFIKLTEKEEVQVRMAYELNESHDALHAANNKWQSDNMH